MVEKLVNIIISEFNKHNMEKSCLLASYMCNQCIPDSVIVKGVLIRGEFCFLHVWIKYNNKIYDFSNEQIMRNYNIIKYLPPPRYSLKEPHHLENVDDNYDEFFLGLQNFDTKTYYNMAPLNVKKCIKAVRRKYAKINHFNFRKILSHIYILI